MKKWALLIGLLALLGGMMALWSLGLLPWATRNGDPPTTMVTDPRTTYAGPFANIHPKVRFIGNENCALCHEDIATQFHTHPMGRALAPIGEDDKRPIYDVKHRHPFEAFDSLFRIDRKDGLVEHRQIRLDREGKPIYDFAFPVDYVIGSGEHAKSYLTNRNGFLYMTPITWYAQKEIWDTSPGYARIIIQQGRTITHECLFCHTNRAEPKMGTANGFEKPIFHGHAIGCERCHGPGDLHWQEREQQWEAPKKFVKTGPYTLTDPTNPRHADFTIVNPRHLPPRLRDAVCEQCHLIGLSVLRRDRGLYDFRPGLPLESCWSIFVDAKQSGQNNMAFNHVEQMHLSRCWQKTSGWHKLGCISCHNPHVKPAPGERITWYRQRCLQCHTSDSKREPGHHGPSCALPVAKRILQNKDDSCITCHMTRFQPKDFSHAALTDHRILRRPGSVPGKSPHQDDSGFPITHFHKGKIKLSDTGFSRDLAIGLYLHNTHDDVAPQFLNKALSLLDQALADFPRDAQAWEIKAQLQLKMGKKEQALQTFYKVLEKNPKHEIALRNIADILQSQRKVEEAIGYWRRAVKVNPWNWRDHANLAVLLTRRQHWDEAGKHIKTARRLAPDMVQVRMMWISYLLHEGKRDDAEAELRIVQRLEPGRAGEVARWFKAQKGK